MSSPSRPPAASASLTHLTNPDLAVLLLVVGALLIYLEFNVPGTIVPGALGTLLLRCSAPSASISSPSATPPSPSSSPPSSSWSSRPSSLSHGVLAFTGLCCLVLGLATLINGPIAELRVHTSTALAAGIGFGAVTFFLAWIALKARRNKILTGPDAMLGNLAVAITPLAPFGEVEIRGELWRATLEDPQASLPTGAQVIVRRFERTDALLLIVEPTTSTPSNH